MPAPRTELRDSGRYLLDSGWTARQVRRTLRITRRQFDHLVTHLSDRAAIADDPFSRARRAAQRCPGCGGLVFLRPCLTCELRAREQREAGLRKAA